MTTCSLACTRLVSLRISLCLTLVIGSERYPIVRISKRKLRQVDVKFDGREIRGLEQNPETAMARDGQKVMQFLVEGCYVAVVVDGEAKVYGA